VAKKKHRRRSLAGTHLFQDSRTGVYIWRRTDPSSGKRTKRSTRSKNLEVALRKAAQFEEEFDRSRAGLKSFDCWRKELAPLIGGWLEARAEVVAEKTLAQNHMNLVRALDELNLVRAADLDDVPRLHDRLLALGRRTGRSKKNLLRCYQHPLKQFSRWLAGNRRHLDRDPLSSWEPIRTEPTKPDRRVFLPEEVARAFFAVDRLDEHHGQALRLRPTFLAFLIVAPREGALISRDIGDLRLQERRLHLGEGVGKKRRGAGSLDPKTARELASYVGNRSSGPLFLSSMGKRWTAKRVLGRWKQAFSLAIVDELWPEDASQDLGVAYLVSRSLMSGCVRVSKGGNPNLIRPETRERLRTLERRVQTLCEELHDDWRERLLGVDVHAFRKTHSTWAESQGVPRSAIDKQCGWSGPEQGVSMEILRIVAGSKTGRSHYRDLNSRLFDSNQSALAVRNLLDEATAKLISEGRSLLLPFTKDSGAAGTQAG
tara:strand:- start:163 stop:1620 length:1458 start_codon:yes stop_codon:yes gene_type:complete